MNKTKKQIIFFILIVVLGVSYSINTYIIVPQKLLVDEKAKEVQANVEKLQLLKSKSSQVMKLKAEVAKLKKDAESLGDVTVVDIDTPQLIYDFYSSCTEFGIKGENLAFQLADSSAKAESPTSSNDGNLSSNTNANTSDSSTGSTSGSSTNNQSDDTSSEPQNDATTSNNSAIAKTTTDLLRLTIELKVSGDKNKVEKYIRNLNSLTSRKINVKSIKLEATALDNKTANTENVASTATITNGIVLPAAQNQVETLTDQVTADIIFNQYIYNKGENVIRTNSYDFYDEKTGLSDFSDMFK